MTADYVKFVGSSQTCHCRHRGYVDQLNRCLGTFWKSHFELSNLARDDVQCRVHWRRDAQAHVPNWQHIALRPALPFMDDDFARQVDRAMLSFERLALRDLNALRGQGWRDILPELPAKGPRRLWRSAGQHVPALWPRQAEPPQQRRRI